MYKIEHDIKLFLIKVLYRISYECNQLRYKLQEQLNYKIRPFPPKNLSEPIVRKKGFESLEDIVAESIKYQLLMPENYISLFSPKISNLTESELKERNIAITNEAKKSFESIFK